TDDEAQALIATVEGWQHRWLAERGSRFVFLADEIYLLAGRPLPPARAYEGFPVVEDGIGLVRRFEDSFARALARRPPPRVRRPRRGRARRRAVAARAPAGPRPRLGGPPRWPAAPTCPSSRSSADQTSVSPRSSTDSSAGAGRSCTTCPASRATASTAR